MKNWVILAFVFLCFVSIATVKVEASAPAGTLPAFPGAMGGGTLTPGGRNGAIMEITNTNDTGAGSYRACVTAPGPRTCVCRAGGVIPARSDVTISQPYLTLDGQACPGGGLIVGDGQINGRPLNITTHDVVIRYMSYWMNNPNIPTGPNTGTTGIEIGTGAYNVVLDHLSCSAAGNKCEISYTSTETQAAVIHDDMLMNSIIALPNQGHPVGPMTDTAAFAYLNVNQDFFRNFFTQIGHRVALYNTNKCHWVNNVTYNWSDPSAGYGFAMEPQGPSECDMIGNVWKTGNMNKGNSANPHPVNINATGSDDCSVNCWNGATQPSDYMSGNICDQGTDWDCAAKISSEGGPETGTVPAPWRRTTPLSPEPNPIVATPAQTLAADVLATVGNSRGVDCSGAWFMRRNSIDEMLIAAYPNGNGALFTGQYPAPTAAKGTACAEDPTTHVPSAYLAARGLQPGMSPWAIAPGDIYPILETYNNGNGVTPPPVTTWTGWLGADALPGAAVGATVTVGATAGPLRQSPCTTTGGVAGAPVVGAPSMIGLKVTILPGPPAPSPVCSTGGNVAFWQVTTSATPPPTPPTVSCTPPSIATGGTVNCSSNQSVTWSASAGSISAAGVFTAPSTAQTVTITGTNANGKGTAPVTVTSVTPPPATYPTITIAGPVNTLKCTANPTTGFYTCQ